MCKQQNLIVYYSLLKDNTTRMQLITEVLSTLRENFYQQSLYQDLIFKYEKELDKLKLERKLFNIDKKVVLS